MYAGRFIYLFNNFQELPGQTVPSAIILVDTDQFFS